MITSIKRFLQSFFGLSRTETNGFLILLPLLLIIIFSEPIYAWWVGARHDDFSIEQASLDSLVHEWDLQKKIDNDHIATANKSVALNRFYFNPNNATPGELLSLGFSQKLVARLAHYREKGGKFKIRSDLNRLYGIDDDLYKKLYKYIQLPERIEHKFQVTEFPGAAPFVKKEIDRLDLNAADTLALKSIYGIGSKLSLRIIKYRQRLGGFVTLNQLREVYGLDSTVINRLQERFFIQKDFIPQQININKATENELNSHPYIPKTVASSIAVYRFQHGNFKEVNDLSKLHLMKDELIQKISPYLTLEE